MSLAETKRTLSHSLGVLRRRLKLALFAESITYLVPVIAGTALAAVVLDYLLRLGVAGRLILAACVVAVAVERLVRCVIGPAAARLSDAHVARLIAQKDPETGDQVLSAIELRDDVAMLSPTLTRAAASRAAELAGTARIVDPSVGRSVARNGSALVLLVGAAFALNALSPYGPRSLGVGLQRLMQPWDAGIRWPQRTRIALALEYDGRRAEADSPMKVARGDAVRLVATESGVPTETAWLHYEMKGLKAQSRLMSRDEAQPARFALVVPNIIGDAEFRAAAGDGESNRVRLVAIDRPAVKRIRVSVTPPAYAGRAGSAAEREPPAQETGLVRALRGATARIVLDTSKEVQSCSVFLQKANRPVTDVTQVSPTRFVINLLVREDDLYIVKLRDLDGFEGARPEEYEVQGVADRPPAVKVLEPPADGSMLPTGAISFKFEVNDDLGIREMFVQATVNDAASPNYVLRLKGLEDMPKYFLQKSWAFDLSKVRPALNPGDHVTFQAFAHDGREDVTRGIRSLITQMLPDVDAEAKASLAEHDRVVDAQYDKLTKDPASLEQVADAEVRERMKGLLDALAKSATEDEKVRAARELKAFIAVSSRRACELSAAFAKRVDDEYARLLGADAKAPPQFGPDGAAAKNPSLREPLARLSSLIGLKQVIGSGVGASEVIRMNLIDREELAAMLAEQQASLGTTVEEAADLQGRNAARTGKIADDVSGRQNLEGYEALVLDCQLSQELVETKLTVARDKYEGLVKTIVQNGLDTSAAKKRVAHISGLFAAVIEKRLPAVRASVQEAKNAAPTDRAGLLRKSVLVQADGVVEMRDIVAKLRGWSDIEKLIVRARKIIDIQELARAATAALAAELTGQTLEQLDNKGRERLASAASAQKAVRTETEMLEDDLGRVAEQVKAAEAAMYLRTRRVLDYARKEQVVEKMAQCEDLIGRNQCVAAGGLQTEILTALRYIVQSLEAAVDPEKYDIPERGVGEIMLSRDAVFSELEQALEPMLKQQREILRLTRELAADRDRTARPHLIKLDQTATKQEKVGSDLTKVRQAVLDAVQADDPSKKLHNIVVIPVVLSELAGTMKIVADRLRKDDTGGETQELEEECIRVMQDFLAALRRESIVLAEVRIAEPVVLGGGQVAIGAVEDVRLVQLMQVAVNALTVRLDKARKGEQDFKKLPELLRARIGQLGDRQLLIADLCKTIGGLVRGTDRGREDAPVMPLPAILMKQVGDAIKAGQTGESIQKEQQKIVAMLQEIIRQAISAVLAHSSLPDQMREVAGGDASEGQVDLTRPSPDLTHLLPGLKGKRSIEEMLLDMKKLEAWAKFTAKELEQIRMGRMGQYRGKYGELVKRYYMTLAGAAGGARAPSKQPPGPEK